MERRPAGGSARMRRKGGAGEEVAGRRGERETARAEEAKMVHWAERAWRCGGGAGKKITCIIERSAIPGLHER